MVARPIGDRVAALIADRNASDVTLLGHSFGGVVAALIGTGWFGPRVREVLAFGVKIDWTDDEVNKARELASRPARSFATRGEAVERFLKVSGLHGLVDPQSEDAAAGVTGADGDFRVAMDPRIYRAVGPSIERILRLCEASLRLAAGARDPMVSLATMQRIDPAAIVFEGAGHNVHWEAPELVWRFVERAGR
jgi:pimeloyl-ACP methyl ester carboxylesterase